MKNNHCKRCGQYKKINIQGYCHKCNKSIFDAFKKVKDDPGFYFNTIKCKSAQEFIVESYECSRGIVLIDDGNSRYFNGRNE